MSSFTAHAIIMSWAWLAPLLFTATSTAQPAVSATRPAGLSTTQPSSAPATQATTTIAFPIYEQTVAGNFVAFPDAYRGKLVLIHFWASWCSHSKAELPYWKDAYAKYHDRGLEIIGISSDKNKNRTVDQLRAFLTQNNITWEQIYQNTPQLSQIYQIESLPISLLVDGTTGEVLERGQSLRRGGLARHIEAQLKKPGTIGRSSQPSP